MKTIRVVAGVILKDSAFLLGLRTKGAHLEGFWEFPGGKVDEGETDEEALRRELSEELDIAVTVGPLINEVTHAYPEKTVHLLFYEITDYSGEPKALVHDELAWVTIEAVEAYALPPADAPLIDCLRKRFAK